MTEEEKAIFDANLKKVKKVFKYIIGFISILLVFLLFAHNCTDKKYQRLKGEYKQLEKNYQKQKDGVKVIEKNRIKERDSLNFEIKKREAKNKELVANNQELETKVNSIKDKKINVPKDVQGLAEYFNERYKTNEVKPIENKVGLTENVAYDVSYDLEEADKNAEILPLKDKQIENQNTQISNLEKDKKDVTTKLVSAEKLLEAEKELNKTADKNIENLNYQLNTLTHKSTFQKLIIPISFLAGAYIGHKITK